MVNIIGVDCATKDARVGLALGHFGDGRGYIDRVSQGPRDSPVIETLASWLTQRPALIALDAPLGWPVGLSEVLGSHAAGEEINVSPERMFSRATDRFVRETIGKQPFEVGANLIARTAHSALSLLQGLRELTGEPIPLAWDPQVGEGISAIEVYPAATLLVKGLRVSGYKRRDGREARRGFLRKLSAKIPLPPDEGLIEASDDAIDAVVCVLAGVDFLRGEAMEPLDWEIARKEGWIWFQKPPASPWGEKTPNGEEVS